MKIVINKCYGGFGLSKKAVLLCQEISGDKNWGGIILPDENIRPTFDVWCPNIERTDPVLIKAVEVLGKDANGSFSKLIVEDIRAGSYFKINDNDGYECISYKEDMFGWSVAK